MLGKKSGLTYCDIRERYEHLDLDVQIQRKERKEKRKRLCWTYVW